MQEHKLGRMKITFNVSSKIEKQEIFEKLKLVLFKCMVKMHELATTNCPVDTSRLVTSIKIYPFAPGFTKYLLFSPVEYAMAVEFGTGPRVIVPVKKRALAFEMDGKKVVVKKVMHPGSEAKPYFRPALDQVKGIWVKKYFDRVFAQKA